MAIDLTNLLARHYSTPGNGLILEDSDTIRWEHDGFGHLTAHHVKPAAETVEPTVEPEVTEDVPEEQGDASQ